jgi:hypothetical protein
LNWPTCLLLNDNCALPNSAAADKVANFDFDDVTSTPLAVDRESRTSLGRVVGARGQARTERSNLLWLQRALGADNSAHVP